MYVEVASRELRNDTAGLLRRVEAGDTVVITQDHDFHALSGVAGLTVIEV